jgi:hypothetical protein
MVGSLTSGHDVERARALAKEAALFPHRPDRKVIVKPPKSRSSTDSHA